MFTVGLSHWRALTWIGALSLLAGLPNCSNASQGYGRAPAAFRDYKSIESGPIRSAHYSLEQLIKQPLSELVLLEDLKQKLLVLRDEPSFGPDESTYIYWKVDQQGRLIDSIALSIALPLFDSSLFFDRDT